MHWLWCLLFFFRHEFHQAKHRQLCCEDAAQLFNLLKKDWKLGSLSSIPIKDCNLCCSTLQPRIKDWSLGWPTLQSLIKNWKSCCTMIYFKLSQKQSLKNIWCNDWLMICYSAEFLFVHESRCKLIDWLIVDVNILIN